MSYNLVHLIHAGFEFPLRFFRHDRERVEVIESDGGRIEPEQVDAVIVGVGETYVIKLPVTWEGDLFLRVELLVECKGYECLDVQVPFFDIRLSYESYYTSHMSHTCSISVTVPRHRILKNFTNSFHQLIHFVNRKCSNVPKSATVEH